MSKEQKIVLGWACKNQRQKDFAKATGVSQPVVSRCFNMYHAWSALVAEGEDVLEAVAGATVTAAAGTMKTKTAVTATAGSMKAKAAVASVDVFLSDNPSSPDTIKAEALPAIDMAAVTIAAELISAQAALDFADGVFNDNPSSSSLSDVSVEQQERLGQQQYIDTLFTLAEEGPDTIKTLVRYIKGTPQYIEKILSENFYFASSYEEKIVLGWAFDFLNKTKDVSPGNFARALAVSIHLVCNYRKIYYAWSDIVAEGKDVLVAAVIAAEVIAARKVAAKGHHTPAFELFAAGNPLLNSPVQQRGTKRKPEDLSVVNNAHIKKRC